MPIQPRPSRSTHNLSDDPDATTSPSSDSNKSDERAFSTPKRRASTTVSEHTPKRRRRYGSSTRSQSKANGREKSIMASAIALPKNQNSICVVTRVSNAQEKIECSHIIPMSTSAHVITRLEYCWKIPHHELNVDSHRNSQTVTSTLHERFNMSDGWFWVPYDSDIVSALHKKYVGKNVQCDPHSVYKEKYFFQYRLVAHKEMIRLRILQYSEHPDWSAADITLYRYPYSDLALFNLHISPHFVIYNTGRKISDHIGNKNLTAEAARDLYGIMAPSELFETLVNILAIYRAWMSVKVPSQFTNGKSIVISARAPRDKDPDDSDDDSLSGVSDSDNYDDISDTELIDRIEGWRENVRISIDNLEASSSALFERSDIRAGRR